MSHPSRHRGFVLVSVLWVVVGIGIASTVALLAARESIATSRNRVALAESEWRAQECIERAQATIAHAMRPVWPPVSHGRTVWAALDDTVANAVSTEDCTVWLEPVGTAVNANNAGSEQLRALFIANGAANAGERVDALMDWRDTDSEPRPLGAERNWYLGSKRLPPRDGRIASEAEIARVRGFDSTSVSGLTVELGRICLNHAQAAVLASLPGFSSEVVEHVLQIRAGGGHVTSLIALTGGVSAMASDTLLAHFRELSDLTTIEPDAWLLIAEARAGMPSVTTTLELRLANAGVRAAVVRRRIR